MSVRAADHREASRPSVEAQVRGYRTRRSPWWQAARADGAVRGDSTASGAAPASDFRMELTTQGEGVSSVQAAHTHASGWGTAGRRRGRRCGGVVAEADAQVDGSPAAAGSNGRWRCYKRRQRLRAQSSCPRRCGVAIAADLQVSTLPSALPCSNRFGPCAELQCLRLAPIIPSPRHPVIPCTGGRVGERERRSSDTRAPNPFGRERWQRLRTARL